MSSLQQCSACLEQQPDITNTSVSEKGYAAGDLENHLDADAADFRLTLQPMLNNGLLRLQGIGLGEAPSTARFYHLLARLNASLNTGSLSVDEDGEILYRQTRICAENGEGPDDPATAVLDRMVDEARQALHFVGRYVLDARLQESGVPDGMRQAVMADVDARVNEAFGEEKAA